MKGRLEPETWCGKIAVGRLGQGEATVGLWGGIYKKKAQGNLPAYLHTRSSDEA